MLSPGQATRGTPVVYQPEVGEPQYGTFIRFSTTTPGVALVHINTDTGTATAAYAVEGLSVVES